MNTESILKELTFEEKVALLCGKDAWHLNGVPRLGIPEILVTDGPHGLRLSEGLNHSKTKPATALPVEAGIAATWNEDLIEDVARAVGLECQHYGVSVLLGPGVNGKRSPLGGRNFEYYSEDPYLSGKIASAFVRGVQAQGVGTCVKHFAGNEQETRRFRINSVIDERSFHEIYLAPFEMTIREADPWTMMGAYNKVGGEHACQNQVLLEDILRKTYGYEGLIMSDWSAVVDKVLSIKNGLDLEMPGPQSRDAEVIKAVQSGDLDESIVDIHAGRVLDLIKKSVEHKKEVKIDWDKHHKLAVKLAEESMVLLKNEDILPLKRNEHIGIIGGFAEEPRFQGGGSSHMNPMKLDVPLDCIKKHANVKYAKGYEAEFTNETLLNEVVTFAKASDKLIIFTGTTEKLESEGFDRADMKIPSDHLKVIQTAAQYNKNIVIVLNAGSAIETRDFEDQSQAIIMAWLPGEGGGQAIANILFGLSNPSGKLTESFPICLENNPSFGYFPGNKWDVVYSEGLLTGYRYYDTRKQSVQYPFGHGLSYTNFSYSDLSVDLENHCISVKVKNVGMISGQEVVQVYIKDLESYEFRPEKELKGFAKVDLEPGQEKRVTVNLGKRAFAYYLTHLGRFAVESGQFEIQVGSSSREIHIKKEVYVEGEVVREHPTMEDTLNDWLDDFRTQEKAHSLLVLMEIDEYSQYYGIMIGMPMTKVLWFFMMQGASAEEVEAVRRLLEE